jgi:putative ABC transport system permease protein
MSSGFDWKGKDPAMETSFGTFPVTPEYGKTIGWQFEEGRDFAKQSVSDSSGFIINESAVRYIGLKNPVGQLVRWNPGTGIKDFKILGVVKDMIMNSPFTPAYPTVFYLQGNTGMLYVKINPNVSARDALARISAVWGHIAPAEIFSYQFVNEDYARKFAAEERVGELAAVFAVLAILISCLGIFGMASFVAEQRMKEIGIRKVLGASVFNVWRLLSMNFVMLVIISLLIASPVAWYFMHHWLQNYQYRTEISWWIFVVAGLCALLITLLTVSFQTIRAALTNPVTSLRSE